MGTSNFYNVNARNVYAVLMNYERPVLDSEGEETDVMEDCAPDTWECDDFFSNLKENAEELLPLIPCEPKPPPEDGVELLAPTVIVLAPEVIYIEPER